MDEDKLKQAKEIERQISIKSYSLSKVDRLLKQDISCSIENNENGRHHIDYYFKDANILKDILEKENYRLTDEIKMLKKELSEL